MAEMARHVAARNGMPAFRPYVYQGTGEDIYQGAHGTRRRDHREVILPGPEDVSYGWRREQLADLADLGAAMPPVIPVIPASPPLPAAGRAATSSPPSGTR